MPAASLDEEAIFKVACQITSPEARAGYLQQVCGDDHVLCDRVALLLQLHDDERSFLESPVPAAYALTAQMPPSEQPGTIVGPYKLLEQIGEGGFGVVFMAEQAQPVRRRVALKVIKPGMDTRQVIARFEAERQALALMEHPNIAKVLDAGATDTGRPYFVMELVKGVPITEYCDQHQLTPRERLELFVTVCLAVQHAHQKGIIHRDIKPSNVLVTLHDEQPVVKVIDFGVAKATSALLTERTLFTAFAQMIGTPLYMSPEQAQLNGLDVDTRSDIYSLGVLLYELLTGTTPFDKERFQSAGYDEIRRIIHDEEPARPSARVSTLGPAGITVSARRRTDADALRRQCRGELDWIVMKCLEKDRNRRYETPASLAADVKRFLADEPVEACPPSLLYRFRKFARRRRGALISISAVALAVLLAVTALAVSTSLVWDANQNLTESLDRERQEANFHRITLAHSDLSADNLGRALKLLEACPEDLREWEWHYLMRLCRVEPLVLRDQVEVHAVSFSPDGERLASAGADGAVRIWNSRTGDVVQSFAAHSESVVSVIFHPDGRHLASAGTDRQAKVWDLATGSQVFAAPCDAIRKFGSAHSIAFRPPDRRQLATGSEGTVRVWDWSSGQLLHTLPGYESHSITVAFSRAGQLLATGGTSPHAQKLWDAETGQRISTLAGHRHPVSAMAFSPDDTWLASASFDRSVKLWETATGRLLHTLDHTGNVLDVACSPDGRRLASGGEDKTVRIWDPATGREVLCLRGHTGMCGCVAFSPDGRRLASASLDGTIRIWDATPLSGDERQEELTFAEHRDEIRSVAFSPDGRWIASAGAGRELKVWDAQTGVVRLTCNSHDQIVFCVAWQPDGRRLASAGSDGRLHSVKVWDAGDGREAFGLLAGPDSFAAPYACVAFSPDGRFLVTGKVNGAVQVWDAQTGREVGTVGTHDRDVRGVVFSPDGTHMASASTDGIVKLWDATRLNQMQHPRRTLRARVPGPSLNVAFSPDSRRLATAGAENTIRIWDTETGQEQGPPRRGHSGEVYALAFSPDEEGRWIASGGEDSTVKVWDSRDGTLVRSFRGHTGLVSALAFSPDGRSLASGSRDTTVKIWDVAKLSDLEREP